MCFSWECEKVSKVLVDWVYNLCRQVCRWWKSAHVLLYSHFSYSILLSFLYSNTLSLLDRNTCVHWSVLCRGACCDSHVSGDGEDHHQADVRFPEELHLWWWLWMRTGGIRLGSPRPQSWAGTLITEFALPVTHKWIISRRLFFVQRSQTISNWTESVKRI